MHSVSLAYRSKLCKLYPIISELCAQGWPAQGELIEVSFAEGELGKWLDECMATQREFVGEFSRLQLKYELTKPLGIGKPPQYEVFPFNRFKIVIDLKMPACVQDIARENKKTLKKLRKLFKAAVIPELKLVVRSK